MDSSLLNVLHDSADDDIAILVSQGVNVQLSGAVEVLVDQDGGLVADLDSFSHIP